MAASGRIYNTDKTPARVKNIEYNEREFILESGTPHDLLELGNHTVDREENRLFLFFQSGRTILCH
jgi:broad specificity polyphosphatase/5'/3'-nucleotidase SurE